MSLPVSRSGLLDAAGRAVWVAAAPGAIAFMVMQTYVHVRGAMVGADSHAYWMAARLPQTWYDSPPAYRDAYLYSPAFAQVLWPFGHLPWPVFQVLWVVAQVAALSWLLAPLGWRRALVLAPFFVTELLLGNVYLFFAVALVAALGRAPGALVLPLLTKIAPGVVGLWFLLRREWGAVAWAAGTTLAVVAVSATIDPGAWVAWLSFLRESSGDRGVLVALRFVLAATLVVVAVRLRWVWLLAPALILASPVLGGFGPLAVLAAVPRLLLVQRDLQGSPDAAVRPPLGEPSEQRSLTPASP